MRQKIKVNDLIPHSKNSMFFDDIAGDAWSEFLESVRTSGVIEPIVVTTDMVIVSGHQRVRACKELHIEEIDAEIKKYDSDEEIMKQLIETNIRQRGVGNTNPVKFGRCLMELERIYGIQHGGDRKSEESSGNNSRLKTQPDLADELGMDVKTLSNYKRLAQAIPELQSLVESGKVTKTVALGIMKRLSEDEQKQLVDMLPTDEERISGHQIKFYESRIEQLNNDKNDLQNQITGLEQRERDLENQIADLEEAQPEPQVREVEVAVVPDDYEDLKKANAELEKCIADMQKTLTDSDNVSFRCKANLLADLDELNQKYKGYIDVGSVVRQWVKKI